MIIIRRIIVGLALLIAHQTVLGQQSSSPPADLAAGFASPPTSAKPYTWWHWMNGNITREGITLDLEAMQRVGIGGFQIFQAGTGIPKGPVIYGSPEHLELLKHAAREADRLGLEFAMHNCPGWSSSGGPWMTPELSMQVLVMTETAVAGGKKINVVMPQPAARANYYRDVMVLAFPTPADKGERIANWFFKANFAGRGSGSANRAATTAPATAPAAGPETPAIDPASVVNLTSSMNAQGQLTWDAPAGNWTIMRIGHTTTGAENSPSPDGGAGLECDKFNRAAIEFHFNHFFGDLFETLKPLAARGLVGAVIDSYEKGLQNWTGNFPQEFKNRCGYDLTKYLPAMFGRVVGSLDTSERFLWDIRKVQADLMAENYYGRFAELCHEHGFKAYIEPYNPGNFDEMAVGRYPDVPMGEFWQNQPNQHSIKLVASVAHINGRSVVAAESFTSQSRWTDYPYSLKALGDSMYTQGLSKFIFHRYAMQPNPTAVPGMTMGPWGGHFDRTNTWFDHGMSAWLDYVKRCQYLLQQGLFAGDLLYFAGEDSPARAPQRQDLNPPVPPGYDYDTIDPTSIMSRIKVERGRIVLPDGMSYRVFVLPEQKTITLPLLRKIRDLVQEGMVLVVGGPKPRGIPNLIGYPASETEFQGIAAEVWGDLNGTNVTEHAVGNGKVFWGQPLPAVLAGLKIKPDFEPTSRSNDAIIHYIHRRVGDTEIYFVTNRREQQSEDLVCTFNVEGKRPELWDAATGDMAPACVYDVVDGRTRLPLHLDPSGSIFVVFRSTAPAKRIQAVLKDGATVLSTEPLPAAPQVAPAPPGGGSRLQFVMPMPSPQDPRVVEQPAARRGEILAWQNGTYSLRDNQGQSSTVRISGVSQPVPVDGPWRVYFPPNRGAPSQATFNKLISWADSTDEGIRYFSGTAIYTTGFGMPQGSALAKRMYLDLGKVQVVAEVRVNGRDLGILWKPPFIVDITEAMHSGDNDLEIKVTNLWPNRLIGDEHLPAENEYVVAGASGAATTGSTAARGTPNAIVKLPEWYVNGLPKPSGGRITFTTWHHWSADDTLIESGLIGPVLLRAAMPIPVEH